VAAINNAASRIRQPGGRGRVRGQERRRGRRGVPGRELEDGRGRAEHIGHLGRRREKRVALPVAQRKQRLPQRTRRIAQQRPAPVVQSQAGFRPASADGERQPARGEGKTPARQRRIRAHPGGMNMVVQAPGEAVRGHPGRQRIGAFKPAEDLPAHRGDAVAPGILQVKNGGAGGHEHSAPITRHRRDRRQLVRIHPARPELAGAVGVFQQPNAPHRPAVVAGVAVGQRLRYEQPAVLVKRNGRRRGPRRFGGGQFQAEPGLNPKPGRDIRKLARPTGGRGVGLRFRRGRPTRPRQQQRQHEPPPRQRPRREPAARATGHPARSPAARARPPRPPAPAPRKSFNVILHRQRLSMKQLHPGRAENPPAARLRSHSQFYPPPPAWKGKTPPPESFPRPRPAGIRLPRPAGGALPAGQPGTVNPSSPRGRLGRL